MKTENNGKLAIAIVAMFAVALSVVGFTYAYFTATAKNNAAPRSAEVVAGMMEVEYTQNRTLTGTNIVPGWISDGLHYASTFNDNGILKSKSLKTSTETIGETKGAVKPAQFNVANTANSKNDAYYVVTLKNITNGIATADQVNMTYELTDVTNSKVVGRGQLPATTTEDNYVVISELLTKKVTDADATEYSLVLKYKDTGDDTQNASQDQTVSATVSVVGVSTAENGKYYDAIGTEITPATTAADTFGTDNAEVQD